MFDRVNDLFVVTVNNLGALEGVSEWIYNVWKGTYFIQIETFPNMTIYHICIPMDKGWDKKVIKKIEKYIKLTNRELLVKAQQ